jgi:hypothetical protein
MLILPLNFRIIDKQNSVVSQILKICVLRSFPIMRAVPFLAESSEHPYITALPLTLLG